MNQSLATLFLCCSAFAGIHAALAADTVSRAPWLDQPAAAAPIAPLQNKSRPQSLSDFGLSTSRGADAPWMKDAAEKYRQASPAGAAAEQEATNYDIQVFISEGMPDGVLRHLFQQALDYPAGRVRFVLRGFEPQKLGPLISKMRGLFKDPYSEHIALEVDPNAFRIYKVDSVPVYLVREGEKWYEVQGSQSLVAAQENVKNRGKKVVGELYPIAEPDILAVMQERAKNFDWKPVLARAQQRVAKNLKPGFDLPTSSQEKTAYFVPTFTAPHDITTPAQNGQVEVTLAKAGQSFKLLDHTRLQTPVIVFDPSDSRQVEMVRRWVKDKSLKNADLFVVGDNLAPKDNLTPVVLEIAKAMKRPVYPWLAKLSERMGVEAVPAIVEQEGDRLRVRYFDPEKR